MKTLPLVLAFAATLVTTTAPRAAQSPSGIDYLNRTPAVVGAVTAADDHSVTLTTDSGSPMTFLIDSRSVVPTELPSGTQVRVEFRALGADAFHAGRITPLTGAEIRAREESAQPHLRAASESVEGTPTSMSSTEADGTPVAQAGEAQPVSEPNSRAATSAHETAASPSSSAAQTEPAPSDQSRDESQLPRTAGSLPLIGLVGAVALAVAIGIGFLRRRRA